MKLLITGGTGLLGSEFVRVAEHRGWGVVAPTRVEMDIPDAEGHQPLRAVFFWEGCARVVTTESPDWVIHCAAFTKVDQAEVEPDEAMRVNRTGTASVARAARDAGAGIVHISTDYVFDGLKRAIRWKSPN